MSFLTALTSFHVPTTSSSVYANAVGESKDAIMAKINLAMFASFFEFRGDFMSPLCLCRSDGLSKSMRCTQIAADDAEIKSSERSPRWCQECRGQPAPA